MDLDDNKPKPFATVDDFECQHEDGKKAEYFESKTGQIKTLDSGGWEKLAQELDSSPKNGYCILFIPRAADVQFSDSAIPSSFTCLAVSRDHWKTVVPSLKLPASFSKVVQGGISSVVSIRRTLKDQDVQEPLHMQIGMTSYAASDGFCFASTHSELRKFTSIVMIGCSDLQIRFVVKRATSSPDLYRHPLFILAVFVDLERRRINELVFNIGSNYWKLRKELLIAENNGDDSGYGLQTGKNIPKFSWAMMRKIQSIRDELQEAEAAIQTSMRYLKKACAQADTFFEDNKGNSDNIEVLARDLAESFYETRDRFDEFVPRCRACSEGILFCTDLIRNELARQEAYATAQTTKIGTLVASVALVYLPVTGVATILAMPIFEWTNDWKDLKFRSIHANDSSEGNSGNSSDTGLPVVSGYIWVYAAISAVFIFLTLIPFGFALFKRTYESRPRETVSGNKDTRLSGEAV